MINHRQQQNHRRSVEHRGHSVHLDLSRQSGWVDLPMECISPRPASAVQMHDLLADTAIFGEAAHWVLSIPSACLPTSSAHTRVRTEDGVDYFA